jgi:hypothetical protein
MYVKVSYRCWKIAMVTCTICHQFLLFVMVVLLNIFYHVKFMIMIMIRLMFLFIFDRYHDFFLTAIIYWQVYSIYVYIFISMYKAICIILWNEKESVYQRSSIYLENWPVSLCNIILFDVCTVKTAMGDLCGRRPPVIPDRLLKARMRFQR